MLPWLRGRGRKVARVISIEKLLCLLRGPNACTQVHIDVRENSFTVGRMACQTAQGDAATNAVGDEVDEHRQGAGKATVGVQLIIKGVFPLMQVTAGSVQEVQAIKVVMRDSKGSCGTLVRYWKPS